MTNILPNGAQFLITRKNTHQKVTTFVGTPIELSDLTAVNRTEEEFVKEGRVGFILTNVNEKDASIKFLNANVEEMVINLGESKNVVIDSTELKIELWAVRVDSEDWDKWKVSF